MEDHIGKRIKAEVTRRPDLTIKAFADRLGVHEQTVYDIFRRADINTDLLRRVGEVLDIPLLDFLQPGRPAAAETAKAPAHPKAPQAAPPPPDDDWLHEKILLLEDRLRDKELIISLLLEQRNDARR